MLGNMSTCEYIELPLLLDLDHQSICLSPAVEPCPASHQVNRIFSASFSGKQEQTHTISVSVQAISDYPHK